MGLFKKKGVKKEFKDLPELPRFPSLPGESNFEKPLPQLPNYSTNSLNDRFHQDTIKNEQKTGNFLTNLSGRQIKDAISGKKEEMLGADEFVREQMMSEHLEMKPSDFARQTYQTKNERERFGERNLLKNYETKREEGRELNNKMEFPYRIEKPSKEFELRNWQEPKVKKSGQVFVKIDKFEERLKIFELTKNKIVEMEKMLEDIKELKEKEEKELDYWMAEIQTIKNQTEKVERDIFSKLE